MGTLVLNVGSSSLKAALLRAEPGRAQLERVWDGQVGLPSQEALAQQLDHWLAPALEPWWPEIERVGHRLVHGGERFTGPTALTPAVLLELEVLSSLAPLHNPPALAAIRWLGQRQPKLRQWACFDTAFHATLTPEAYTYALPADWRAGGCRRYGFHGLSHEHLAEVAAQRWGAQGNKGPLRLISCHLGAGCSLAAVMGGRSIDTSMGFTPLEGLVMANRSGSIDPGLLLHLQRRGLSLEALEKGLNQASGLKGLSGLSGDWLELKGAAAAGHSGAKLALAVFRHRLLAGLGAMAASLGGVDMIGLTGGIGSRDQDLMADLQRSLNWLGPLQWLQQDANEEAVIARQIQQANTLSDQANPGSDAGGGSTATGRR